MEEAFFVPTPQRKSSKKTGLVLIGLLGLAALVGCVYLYNSPKPTPTLLSTFDADEQEFLAFIDTFSKSYVSNYEYRARFEIFRDNASFIRAFNSGGKSWSLGINEFADMTFEEFKNIYTPMEYPTHHIASNEQASATDEIPATVDWRTKNAVTSVKNQGQCGSCWAFSTAEGVEGSWAIAGNDLVSLSEQQLVDCSTYLGNQGCNGGLMYLGYEYVLAKGLTSDTEYPYRARDGRCKDDLVEKKVASIKSYTNVTESNMDAMINAVIASPVSVAVEADQWVWQFYFGGVVNSNCGTSLDHGVLVVGYNRDNTPPYWVVKNSWGTSWGEQGYIRIGMQDGDGVCGINMTPSYPTS